MASRKGIVVTAGILGVITVASFLVWALPVQYESSFVVTDFEAHLDGIESIRNIIIEDLDAGLEGLASGAIPADEYTRMAETATIQINEQIILIVESGPPPEWEESYISYMEALRHSNSYVRETIVVAGMIRDGADPGEAQDSADGWKDAAEELVRQSQQSRP